MADTSQFFFAPRGVRGASKQGATEGPVFLKGFKGGYLQDFRIPIRKVNYSDQRFVSKTCSDDVTN